MRSGLPERGRRARVDARARVLRAGRAGAPRRSRGGLDLFEEPLPARKANPRIPQDLATIVRKATEKDPRHRYDSAEDLARDLDAFLDGRPITARPPSLGYLLRLAVARNRTLAATVLVALLALIAGTAVFVAREARLRRVAEGARDEALRAREGEREARKDADRRADEAEEARVLEAARKREAEESLALANRHLARVFFERGDRALAAGDPLAAEALLARSIEVDDRAAVRARLLEARSRGARLVWATDPQVAVVAVGAGSQTFAIASGSVHGTLSLYDGERRSRCLVWRRATRRPTPSFSATTPGASPP
jgi:hypothetical protein